MKKSLCVLIPCHNEEGNIQTLLQRLLSVFEQIEDYSCSVCLVDDGSQDDTQSRIRAAAEEHAEVKYIFFTRNFSHQNALIAGFHQIESDVIITMDADLQHAPEDIPRFLDAHARGYEIVNGIRQKNGGQLNPKVLFSKLFYKLINRISDIELEPNSPDFRLYGSKVLQQIRQYNEADLFLRGYVSWLGFSSTNIVYEEADRHSGKSSYNFTKMIQFGINGITSMTSKPLQWISLIGLFITAIPIIYMIYVLYQWLFHPETLVVGWVSIVMLLTFLQGMTFLFLGIIASYLSQIYNETKKRPNYIINSKKL
jgi:dolichol-phosphate mannosyltransferase